jgi:hypothetical protein
MNNPKHKGSILNFWQLLKEQKIEIPIIQRDYAQGRKDKKELRLRFLNALSTSLSEKKEIKLDFIYGENVDGAFQPLDGQQRLTTLFLIHWYAALINDRLNLENKQILERFSYETRASSREFCKALINKDLLFSKESDKISDKIIDSSWFFLAWKKDPTISSMLRALDDIHDIFSNINNLWSLLINDNNLISFYYVILEDIGLTDDLYIKMNARGKLLTSFENFKATFQKRIQQNGWEKNLKFVESFAFKIDTDWTDLFWSHRKNDRIDDAFIRFISTIAMFQQVIEKSNNRLDSIAQLQRNPNTVKVTHFSKIGYNKLYKYLEVYKNVYKKNLLVKLGFPFWQHSPTHDIFSSLVYEDVNASYTQKVLFFAQTEYLDSVSEIDVDKFKAWMRVIRNIISRGDVAKTGERPAIIRSPETFEGVINLISELSKGCSDIYNYIINNSIKSIFAKEQMDEERIKAKLILQNIENRNIIFQLEDTNFFRGRIGFALECIDYKTDEDNFDSDKLTKIHQVIVNNIEDEVPNDFRRGLLTICDENDKYKYYNYWWSWSFVANANKRCLISKYRELEYYIYGNYSDRDYFKNYVKKLILKLTERDLKDIIKDFKPPSDMPNWQIRLIKEPELLDKRCNSKYIAIPENEEYCYLLRGVRPRDMSGCEKIE